MMVLRHFFSGAGIAAAIVAVVIAGCGGKVVVDVPSGGGGTGGTSTASAGGGAGGCPGQTFGCLQFCGSDFFPANAECVGGAWVCPPGTVDPKTCGVSSCCTDDIQCGDFVFVPCVNNVCKQPVPNGCWSDAECSGLGCVGAFVCPCGDFCDQPDQPGFCEGPQP
ncbi:MAG: hypothetical protein QM820_17585 [Minicystis sp.]